MDDVPTIDEVPTIEDVPTIDDIRATSALAGAIAAQNANAVAPITEALAIPNFLLFIPISPFFNVSSSQCIGCLNSITSRSRVLSGVDSTYKKHCKPARMSAASPALKPIFS
jgi:hypothetical protein